jgi:GxxExxY protein
MNQEPDFSGQHAELSDKVIGSFYKVANELGFGFAEVIYRRAMLIALREAGVKAEEEVAIPVTYHGQWVGTFYADIVVEGVVILEVKIAHDVSKQFEAQLYHYLRSTPIEVGLILAFGERAKFRRLFLTNDRKPNLKYWK